MPYLIDGNNLQYALLEAGMETGRVGLCKLLALLKEKSGQKVTVIFDGPAPGGGLGRQMLMTGIDISFSAGRTADEVIFDIIKQSSASRLLTVVSSDREIRTEARKRRCKIQTSDKFACLLEKISNSPIIQNPDKYREPKEKFQGPDKNETEKWLKEFGF